MLQIGLQVLPKKLGLSIVNIRMACTAKSWTTTCSFLFKFDIASVKMTFLHTVGKFYQKTRKKHGYVLCGLCFEAGCRLHFTLHFCPCFSVPS